MLKFNRQFLVITLPVAAVCAIGGAPDAVAKKKLSYEQAYASCKAQNDRTAGAGDTANARLNMGTSCMKKHGFRLKK
jgi:hypothetical protein